MKQKTPFKVLLIATLALFGATYCYAAAGHDHGNGGHSHGVSKSEAQEPNGGPNGGRLITIVDPHMEFLVTPERYIPRARWPSRPSCRSSRFCDWR